MKILGSESFTRWLVGRERVGAKGKSEGHEGKNGQNRHKGCKQV